ncbi:phospholipase-like protein [Tanacetum coccineum]
MARPLFNLIVEEVTSHSLLFCDNIDCIGRKGISLFLKYTSAIRQLAYDIVLEFLDECLQMSDKTSRLSVDHLCTYVMEIFRPGYMRKPTMTDVLKLYQHYKEKNEFPGMLGSLDWECIWEALGGNTLLGDGIVIPSDAVRTYKRRRQDLFDGVRTKHEEREEVSSDKDVDEWLNIEMGKRMIGQDKDEEEDALIGILKTVVKECNNLKIYAMADVGAGINMIPKSLFEDLKLTNLKKTNMVVEMADMTKKAPLGIVENIPVKIDKFLFRSDFIVIDTLEGPNETMLLGRPFLAMIHAHIDVFRGEIYLGIGNEKVKFDTNEEICHSRVSHEKIYMASSIQKDTDDSSDDSQEEEVGNHLSEDVVSRWYVCKPVHVTFKVCEEDSGIWPTCNPNLSFCSGYDAIYEKEKNGMLKQWVCFRDHERQSVRGNGMKFTDFLKVTYENKNIDEITRERRYYEWVAQNYDFNIKTTKYVDPYDSHHENSYDHVPQNDNIPNDTLRINTYFLDVPQTQLKKPRLRDNLFKEWVKENFDFEGNFERTRDNPYSRNFEVYKEEFDDEIKQLENKYELKAGRKRYALEEVWEKCEKFHDSTKLWYDKGFEEEELWQNGIEKIDYTPPLVKSETFEVHRYTLKNRKSFISITKQMEDILTLGRVNGSRFIEKTRREMDKKGGSTRKT